MTPGIGSMSFVTNGDPTTLGSPWSRIGGVLSGIELTDEDVRWPVRLGVSRRCVGAERSDVRESGRPMRDEGSVTERAECDP